MNRDDRMVQVSNEFAAGAPVVSYVYDAMGRRIVRKKGSEWRMFYYDGLSVAAEKKSANSGGAWAWDRLYTLGPGVIGHVLAESQWSGSAWVSTFLHYDHIGNVTLSTNASGQVVDAYDQDAFGNPLAGPDSGLRLQTKELDADAGLYYFYQRWYDGRFGIFIQSSPFPSHIEQPYIFAMNNTLLNYDPNGLLGIGIPRGVRKGGPSAICQWAMDLYLLTYSNGNATHKNPLVRRAAFRFLSYLDQIIAEFCNNPVVFTCAIVVGGTYAGGEVIDRHRGIPPGSIEDCLDRCSGNPWCESRCALGTL